MADKEIKILPNGKAVPDPCHISKKANEGVVWVTDDGEEGDTSIEFHGGKSPFKDPNFKVHPRGGKTPSGLPIRGKPGDTFTYDVKIQRKSQVSAADPDIKIDP